MAAQTKPSSGDPGHLKLIPDILERNLCFPELEFSMSPLGKVLPACMFPNTSGIKICYFAFWCVCLNLLSKQKFYVQEVDVL
jgi:hypothetical protein